MVKIDSKKVAVLGGGAIALATTADFCAADFKVNLFELPKFRKSIQPIIKRGRIEFTGAVGSLFAKPNMVTTDIGEAIRDVGLIILAVPALAHGVFVETCIPHLKDGQILLMETGYFGCMRFRKIIQNTGKRIILAEMNSTPYTGRIIGPAQLCIDEKRKELFIAALPANDTPKVANLLRNIYPEITPVLNVLQTSLDLINWIIHPPVTLLHKGLIERTKDFSLPVRDSISPSVVKIMNAMERERIELGKAFGLDLLPIKHFYELGGKTLADALRKSREWKTYNFEYQNGTHQYLKEDLYYALPPVASIASLVGVPTPTINALTYIFSVIDEVDYMKEGLTVEKMGLTGLGIKEILKLLEEGF